MLGPLGHVLSHMTQHHRVNILNPKLKTRSAHLLQWLDVSTFN